MIGNTCEVELLFRRLKHVGRSDTEGDMIQADTVGIKMIIDVRLRSGPLKSMAVYCVTTSVGIFAS
jgi:hypothetical protein